MIKTLHAYLCRELLKVAGLALVALTLLMTVLAIMEPLRKQGLGTLQVAALIGYLVPVMVSFTLPIAVLFAATIVYGRFSQDNELLACRASGISTMSLLLPALGLGVMVTVVSLLLSNFVAPHMLAMAERDVKANIERIARRQFRTRGYYIDGPHIVHVAALGSDDKTMVGLVYANTKDAYREKGADVQVVAARTAVADFRTIDGQTFLTPYFGEHAATSLRSPFLIQESSIDLPSIPLKSPAQEDPSWYDWQTLTEALAKPIGITKIRTELAAIRKAITLDMLVREVGRTIHAGRAYDKLRQGEDTYVIRAGEAKVISGDAVELLSGRRPDGTRQDVEVRILRNGRTRHRLTAKTGRVQARWSQRTNRTFATIELEQILMMAVEGGTVDEPRRRDTWRAGQLPLPPDVADFEKTSLEDVYTRAREFTTAPSILDRIDLLRTTEISMFLDKIVAEIHVRTAYSLSCFLLVALGAVLGLIFRGGHLITAFVLTMIPAAIVIVLLLMGKEMVRNPSVERGQGIVAIWGGIAVLLVGNLVLYARLVRK